MTVNRKPTAASNNNDYNLWARECASTKLPVNLKPTIENSWGREKIEPFAPHFHYAISRNVVVATLCGGPVTEWRCAANRRSHRATLFVSSPAQTDLGLATAKFAAHDGNIPEDANRRGHTRRNADIVTSLFGKPDFNKKNSARSRRLGKKQVSMQTLRRDQFFFFPTIFNNFFFLIRK